MKKKKRKTTGSPLANIEVWSVIPLLVVFFGASAFIENPVLALAPYLLVLGWVLWKILPRKINLSSFIGNVPTASWFLPLLALMAAWFIVEVHLTGVILIILSYIWPSFVETLLQEGPTVFNLANPLATQGLSLIDGIILAPIMEELIFRGILLHKLASRWSKPAAIIFSSVIFGILHGPGMIGSTIWGILMCLIYFRTRTLAVPIIIHMLWNWTNFVVEGMTQLFMPGLMTTVELRYETIDAILLLVLSIPIFIFLVRHLWPKDWSLPNIKRTQQ